METDTTNKFRLYKAIKLNYQTIYIMYEDIWL